MTIIESLKLYFKECSLLQSFNEVVTINVDHVNLSDANTYSINEVICEPVIKTYIDGTEQKQFLFTFASVEYYGSDASIENPNISNLNFYESFLKWIKDNSKQGILPVLENGQEAEKIEVLTGGYMFNNSEDGQTSLYQAQLKLIYEQQK